MSTKLGGNYEREFKDGSTVVVDAKADNIIFAKKEIAASTG